MTALPRALLALALALPLAVACGSDDDGGEGPDLPGGDLLDQLAAIPGMSVVEEEVSSPYRFFRLEYDQPADHDDPDGARFQQRITLLHVDPQAPTVLHTTGYYLVEQAFAAELTSLLGANQVHVEQRYFEPSRPSPADWSKLTIAQAAADHHRIVEALRPLYPGAWVSSGASKGGMTSIYHRRFYPDDVDATVAYVAPISFGAPDDRYAPFFEAVGEASCRAALEDHGRELLVRRDAMLPRMEALAASRGWTFERSAGLEGAFEDSVAEFAWGFWQYLGAEYCDLIPPPSAGDDALWDVHQALGNLDLYADDGIEQYAPYYYQAEAQLGYPGLATAHLDDLFETRELERDFLPDGASATYDPDAMLDIDAWVQGEGERLLFVYGEWDPWTAGAFALGEADDSLLLVAPRMHHGAGIGDLAPDDRAAAVEALERWTGAPVDAGRRARRLPPEPPPVAGRPRPLPN